MHRRDSLWNPRCLSTPSVPAPRPTRLHRGCCGLDGSSSGAALAYLVEPGQTLAASLGLSGAGASPSAPTWCRMEGAPGIPLAQLPWPHLALLAEALDQGRAVRIEAAEVAGRLLPHQLRFGPGLGGGVLLAWDPVLEAWHSLPLDQVRRIGLETHGAIPAQALRQRPGRSGPD